MESETYLGDGVYARLDRNYAAVVLTTTNGPEVTNRIVLDDEVLDAFMRWLVAHGILERWERP